MKKFFIVVLFLFNISFAYGQSSEAKIINLIFQSIFKSNTISVFVDSDIKAKVVEEAGFSRESLCSKADIVYASLELDNCMNKPIFTDNYSFFKESKNTIGAFYWSKGRPNIMFDSKKMEIFNLKLPDNLKKYNISEM